MWRGVWGLQIDERRVGLCWTRRKLQGRDVQRGGSHPVPPGLLIPSLTEPNVVDEEAFIAVLKKLLADAGWRGGSTVVALPDLSCRIGYQDFTEVKGRPAEMRQFLGWRMKDRLPFPLQEARIDYQALPSPGNGTRLLYLLARQAVMSQYESLLARAGIEPTRIIPQGLALYRLLAIAGMRGKQLFLSPGSSSDVFIYCDEGVPYLWRVRPRDENGGAHDSDHRIERIARELHETITYLEEEMSVGKPDGLVLPAGTEPALADACKKTCHLPVHAVPVPELRLPVDLLPAAGAALLQPAPRFRWTSR